MSFTYILYIFVACRARSWAGVASMIFRKAHESEIHIYNYNNKNTTIKQDLHKRREKKLRKSSFIQVVKVYLIDVCLSFLDEICYSMFHS